MRNKNANQSNNSFATATQTEEYLKIKKLLEEKILAIEVKINIINECKKNSKAATLEQARILDKRFVPMNDNEIALMLEAKAVKRNLKKNKTNLYEPYLITKENDQEFNKMLASLPEDQPFHYDIVLKNGAHCTPMQIHSDGTGKVRIFFIDAAGDYKNISTAGKYGSSLNAEEHMVFQTGAQTDSFSCSIFSIQDLNSMSKLSQEELISSTMNNSEGDPINLNPRFMKNSQSITELKAYIEANQDKKGKVVSKNKNLEEHISDFSITVETGKEANGTVKTKVKNVSATLKTAKYLKSALAMLEDKYSNGMLESTLENRKGAAAFNKFYQELGLTQEQQKQVKGLYSKEEIKLVLEYDFSRESILAAKCFKDKESRSLVFKYITSHITDKNDIKQQELALLKLNKIKDLSNNEQLELVINYNIRPEEALSQNDYSLPETRKEILKQVKLAYEKGNTPIKRTMFSRQMFSKINDLADKNKIIAVAEYGVTSQLIHQAYRAQLSDIDLDYIRLAYEKESTPEKKREAATLAYNTIANLSNLAEITALQNYDSIVSDEKSQAKEIDYTKLLYDKPTDALDDKKLDVQDLVQAINSQNNSAVDYIEKEEYKLYEENQKKPIDKLPEVYESELPSATTLDTKSIDQIKAEYLPGVKKIISNMSNSFNTTLGCGNASIKRVNITKSERNR